jgi:hypothetical protein
MFLTDAMARRASRKDYGDTLRFDAMIAKVTTETS